MLDRIIISLCHPSKIGHFFKDKLYRVVLYAFGFFLLYVLVCGLTSFSTTYFTSSVIEESVDNLVSSFETSTITCEITYSKETKKLTTTSSTPIVFETDDVIYYFFTDSIEKTDSNESKIIYVFNEDSAYVIYSNTEVGKVSYSSLSDINNFTIKNLISGSINDRVEFKDLIIALANEAKFGMSTVMFVNYMLTGLSYYLVALIILFIMSYLINPTIATNVRVKLCLYDSLIFLVFLGFYIGFSQTWIFYLAILAPVVFVNSTFIHIIKR